VAVLEDQVKTYHQEMLYLSAETIQVRQVVSENYDKVREMEETTQDNR